MTKVSITTLLDAGAHFGHQTRRWNPKMKPYIFGSRGDIYIIDLKQTLYGLDAAYTFVSNLTRKGGTVLFVADDPGPISSQTEQDTRRFGAFAKVPVLDPATPEQGFAMMRAAFDLSDIDGCIISDPAYRHLCDCRRCDPDRMDAVLRCKSGM